VLFSKLHVCNGNLEKCRSDRHSCDFSDNNAVLDNFQFRGDTLANRSIKDSVLMRPSPLLVFERLTISSLGAYTSICGAPARTTNDLAG
jgi:hypothetical protein